MKLKTVDNKGLSRRESYVLGFIMSLILTLVSFFLVMGNIISGISAFITLGSLAFVQVIIQLIFFLHLGEEESPRWNLISFLFMVGVVFIIVAGSLWIMFNLDYRMGHDMRHTRHTGHIGLENL